MRLLSLKLFFAIILFSNQSGYSQIPFKFIDNPSYRIVKAKNYRSNRFRIPDNLNDTTASLESEINYTYSLDKLMKIETIAYTPHGIDITIDSIIYISDDNVRIIHTYGAGKKIEDNRKNINYIQLVKEVLDEKIDKITIDENRYDFRVKKGKIVKIERVKTDNWSKDKYSYKNNKLDKIESQGKYSKVKGLDQFTYPTPDCYKISSSGGNSWCCSFYYYFNSDGYLIKSGVESDTNATITTYEYEKGRGNSFLFDIFGIEKILNGEPIIY